MKATTRIEKSNIKRVKPNSWLHGRQKTRRNLADIEEDLMMVIRVLRGKNREIRNQSQVWMAIRKKGGKLWSASCLNSSRLESVDLRDEIFQCVLRTCSWKGYQFSAPSSFCRPKDRWKTTVRITACLTHSNK